MIARWASLHLLWAGCLARIVAPRRDGLFKLLLGLVTGSQQVAGQRKLVRLGVLFVGQKLLEALRRVVVTSAGDVRLCDVEMRLAGQLVFGKAAQKSPQRGHAAAEVLVVARRRHAEGARELKRGFRNARVLAVAVGRQQVLPSATRLHRTLQAQFTLALPEAGFNIELAAGMVLDERRERLAGLLQIIEVLVAFADAQFDLELLVLAGDQFERLLIEIQRLGVVGLLVRLFRLEVQVGELQINIGDFLFAIG